MSDHRERTRGRPTEGLNLLERQPTGGLKAAGDEAAKPPRAVRTARSAVSRSRAPRRRSEPSGPIRFSDTLPTPQPASLDTPQPTILQTHTNPQLPTTHACEQPGSPSQTSRECTATRKRTTHLKPKDYPDSEQPGHPDTTTLLTHHTTPRISRPRSVQTATHAAHRSTLNPTTRPQIHGTKPTQSTSPDGSPTCIAGPTTRHYAYPATSSLGFSPQPRRSPGGRRTSKAPPLLAKRRVPTD